MFMKYLFGMEGDTLLLKEFINATQKNCGLPLMARLEVKNPFNLKTISYDKESVLDIKAVSETGEIFNIEVQTSRDEVFTNRSLYYWARLYGSQLEHGDQYDILSPVICINILNFKLFAEQNRYHLCFMSRELEDPELFLTDHMAIHFLELPQLLDYHAGNELEKWLYYLKHEGNPEEDENMRLLLQENAGLAKAHEKYLSFTRDPELVDAYEARRKWKLDHNSALGAALRRGLKQGLEQGREEGLEQGLEQGLMQGREQGLEQGREQGLEQGLKKGVLRSQMDIVKNMLSKGYDYHAISECTGIALADVKNLAHS
ncbi:MAG: hypothetical protein CSA21_02485 [Deltaproteobacteria bacterium]|nr:MAG: hypothetical protein CSA21_02485 [Deltaproteobacteria bacterium]